MNCLEFYANYSCLIHLHDDVGILAYCESHVEAADSQHVVQHSLFLNIISKLVDRHYVRFHSCDAILLRSKVIYMKSAWFHARIEVCEAFLRYVIREVELCKSLLFLSTHRDFLSVNESI